MNINPTSIMKNNRTKRTRHLLALPSLAWLMAIVAGCGGGGGGANASPYGIEGFAAKGTLRHALVEVYSIDANGKESTAPIATSETSSKGTYQIVNVGSTPGQQYIVKVKPKADGTTIHSDEIAGDQTLPGNFVLTALAQTKDTTTVVGVTPFSHMVAEAAKKADGGLNQDNIAKAHAVVTELLGFNPASITSNEGKTEDEKKQKIMLTAVAQMAKDGALNCGHHSDAGTTTQCVTSKLAASASTTSLKLALQAPDHQTLDVSRALASAVKTTIAADPLPSSANLTSVLAKLECGNSCTPATPVDKTTQNAINKVTAVIHEIRTDLTTMFSKGGATNESKGQVNTQAFLFKQAVQEVKLNVDQMSKDLDTITMGIDLYKAFKTGKTKLNGKSTGLGQLPYWFGINPGTVYASGCTLYKDDPSVSTTPTVSNTAGDANYIGCSARFARIAQYNAVTHQTTYVDYRHGFSLKPEGLDTYSYKSRASTQTWTCGGAWYQNNSGNNGPSSAPYACASKTVTTLQSDASLHTGTVTIVTDPQDHLSAFQISGDLPPGFQTAPNSATGRYDMNSVSLMRNQGKDQWHLNAKVTRDTNGDVTHIAAFGTLASVDHDGQKLAEIVLKDGSYLDKKSLTAQLDLTYSSFTPTHTAVLKGSLTVDRPVMDQSGTEKLPSHLFFKGGLTNFLASGPVEFLEGSAEIQISHLDKTDATQPASATNTGLVSFAFTGSVTAPEQPRLEIIFKTSGLAYDFEKTMTSAGLTYNRWAGNANTRAVNLSISRTPATATTPATQTASVTEATSGLSMSIIKGVQTAEVKANGQIIGSLNVESGLLTFKDGSIVSLDIQF